MSAFLRQAGKFFRCEHGPTATEYAVVLSMIILVCVVTIKTLGLTTCATFKATDDLL